MGGCDPLRFWGSLLGARKGFAHGFGSCVNRLPWASASHGDSRTATFSQSQRDLGCSHSKGRAMEGRKGKR